VEESPILAEKYPPFNIAFQTMAKIIYTLKKFGESLFRRY